MSYLFDSNILIYLLNTDITDSSLMKIKKILDSSFNISAVSKVEVLGWNKLKGNDLSIATEFINSGNIIEITMDIVDRAVQIRQNFNIKTPDAIIAATAMLNNLTLVTRNTKDFSKIAGLEMYNPFDTV